MFSGYCTSLRLPALLCVHMFLKEKCGSLHASLEMKIYIIPFWAHRFLYSFLVLFFLSFFWVVLTTTIACFEGVDEDLGIKIEFLRTSISRKVRAGRKTG